MKMNNNEIFMTSFVDYFPTPQEYCEAKCLTPNTSLQL